MLSIHLSKLVVYSNLHINVHRWKRLTEKEVFTFSGKRWSAGAHLTVCSYIDLLFAGRGRGGRSESAAAFPFSVCTCVCVCALCLTSTRFCIAEKITFCFLSLSYCWCEFSPLRPPLSLHLQSLCVRNDLSDWTLFDYNCAAVCTCSM